MFPSTPKQVIVKIGSEQENLSNSRRSLKTLQKTATDKENLVGRGTPGELIEKKADLKRKKLSHKKVQAGQNDNIREEDLTSEAGPSENYYKVLAEKRRVALEDALEENQQLYERIADLETEIVVYKQMLEESQSLAEVVSEMIGEQEESGIDVADVSTADETTEDESGNNQSATSELPNTSTSFEPEKCKSHED